MAPGLGQREFLEGLDHLLCFEAFGQRAPDLTQDVAQDSLLYLRAADHTDEHGTVLLLLVVNLKR